MKYHTFCAANSGNGFISLFDQMTDEKKRHIFYIKGGPGCGKSTLLKKIANQADQAEMIVCSGDPNSLDGVILPEQNIVAIDATAPHSCEPVYPGVGGTIIDLGQAWDCKQLNKEKIIELSDQKKPLYKAAYAFLKSAAELHSAAFYPLGILINTEESRRIIDKILCQNGLGEKNEWDHLPEYRFFSAISADGCITLTDTFLKLGKNIIILEDRWMQSHHFLKLLQEILNQRKIHHIIGYHPLFGKEMIRQIIIPEAELSFIAKDGMFPLELPEEQILKTVDIYQLCDRGAIDKNSNKLSFLKNTEKELLQAACEKLAAARAKHMLIEAEYRIGTDFNITEELGRKLINKLVSLS